MFILIRCQDVSVVCLKSDFFYGLVGLYSFFQELKCKLCFLINNALRWFNF